MIPSIPLFVDVFFILMQRVTPAILYNVIQHKIDKLQASFPDITIKEFKIMCVDKGYNIANVIVELPCNTCDEQT
jgi:hypothetical protein